jgi:uncharacterized protein involved in cysteine biosynthesis
MQIPDLLRSKKFQAVIIGLIVTLLIELIPALAPMEEHLTAILAVIAAFVLGQGLADFGKEKAVVEAKAEGVPAARLE